MKQVKWVMGQELVVTQSEDGEQHRAVWPEYKSVRWTKDIVHKVKKGGQLVPDPCSEEGPIVERVHDASNDGLKHLKHKALRGCWGRARCCVLS